MAVAGFSLRIFSRKLKVVATTSWGINARFLIVTQSVDPESSDFVFIEAC
jgi:hypothetical protein